MEGELMMSANEQENEKRETVADIVAELRKESQKLRTVIRPDGYGGYEEIELEGNPYLKNLADRIEEAWKRQEQCYLDQIRDAVNMIGHERFANGNSTVGNAAALREALVSIAKVPVPPIRIHVSSPRPGIIIHEPEPESEWLAMLRECVKRANAALSAPARNCDVGTAKEHTKRFSDFCAAHRHTDLPMCAGCQLENTPSDTGCSFSWAQMPYEDQEGAGNERRRIRTGYTRT